jgi:hypothetical protein
MEKETTTTNQTKERTMDIATLIEKFKISETRIPGQLKASNTKGMTPEIMAEVKAKKAEILDYFEAKKRATIERGKIEAEKRIAEYAELEAQLPVRTFENTPDSEKFAELKKTLLKSYSGAESDGLNMAVSSANGKIRKEMGKYCHHEIEVSFHRTYTSDSRKKIVRTISCKHCGMYITDSAEEKSEYNWN